VSVWSQTGTQLREPRTAEGEAITDLAGVGGEREWWWWNPHARVGHLRVAVTADEHRLLPPGMAEFDAGETGPERVRRRPRRAHK
jgi:hypothetical protein